MATKPYYAPGSLSAAFYDVVTAADARLAGDIEIYAGLAAPGARVLELGTGSGRVAAALAGRGFAVTGIDTARAMLAQAKARVAALPGEVAGRIELRLGDMTALDLKRTFDLVICPYFGLAHLPAGAAWRNAFATAARHLPAGGRAAFHLPLLEAMRGGGPADPAAIVLDQPIGSGGRLRLYVRERRFRDDLGRLDQVIDYVEHDAKGSVARRASERLTYYLTDPVPAAAAAGLVAERPPIALGGIGEIRVFRKP
ncbi:MAG TPA: class I SAM-dependent methyltransferase [Phenylobacterium sp.]|uniref:SAM-dependent methyltransferase n=1 Tax=Phenylobacterium sp. TaxID=1871053 RepID=UPI002BEF7E77|nr:class I SAM-dependent methyltransferase [Phenylobacterium sp.]HSV01630.1 class I SAM-dependent methyltransferase [Phenylobacterium sp.]